jgi:hypothetical protein
MPPNPEQRNQFIKNLKEQFTNSIEETGAVLCLLLCFLFVFPQDACCFSLFFSFSPPSFRLSAFALLRVCFDMPMCVCVCVCVFVCVFVFVCVHTGHGGLASARSMRMRLN